MTRQAEHRPNGRQTLAERKRSDEVTHLVRSCPAFAGLSDRRLARVKPLLRVVRFDQHEEILAYGAPGDALFFLCQGAVKFWERGPTGQEILLEEVDHGFFGEVAVFGGGVRSAAARATRDVVALELRREDASRSRPKTPSRGSARSRRASP